MISVCLTCVIARAEDWPRWGGPRGDGTWRGPSAAQKLPEKWPEAGLPVVWRKEIGGGFGGIAVSDGHAFMMDRQTKPNERERTLCLDAESGHVVWFDEYPVSYGKLDYGNGPRVTPTIHDGRVYTLGAVGHLRCLDAATGKLLWSHDCVAEFEATIPMWGLAASPVIWHDLVIIHPGAKNGCVMALDRLTGREVWRVSDDPAGYCTPIVIASPSGPQVVQWTPEHILGIDAKSGKQLWRVPYKITYGVSIATPIYQQEIVFVAGYWDGSKAIQLGKSPTDTKLLWEDNRHLRGIMSQPALSRRVRLPARQAIRSDVLQIADRKEVVGRRQQGDASRPKPAGNARLVDERTRSRFDPELRRRPDPGPDQPRRLPRTVTNPPHRTHRHERRMGSPRVRWLAGVRSERQGDCVPGDGEGLSTEY